MSKIIKEDCLCFSIYKLKEWGYLNYSKSTGGCSWTSPLTEKSDNIRFTIDLNKQYIDLDYKSKHWTDDNWQDINQRYKLISLPCNYGGRRWFFSCFNCGSIVAKLYQGAGNFYFVCRYCLGLTYRSRLDGYAYSAPELDDYRAKIKRWYYNGKPTKKHLQYLKKEESFLKIFHKVFVYLNKLNSE